MDNQDSQPQLLFPTIPASYCPKGTAAEIFNNLITLFLSQGTVNIPGLGDVNPATITQLQDAVVDLQNQIDAMERQYEAGVGVLAAGDSTVAIALLTPMPSTEYDMGVIFYGNGTETAAYSWSLVTATQTVAGFSLRFNDIPATISSFVWWVRQRYAT